MDKKNICFLLPLLVVGVLLGQGVESGDGMLVDSPADDEAIAGRLKCEESADGFRAIQLQTGNSVEGYSQVRSCFAESDFRLTKDGVLVSAHGATYGNCGMVATRTLAQLRRCTLDSGQQIATLEEFLSLPLTEWYIDLKSSDSYDSQILTSVKVAVSEIRGQGREGGAILMLYDAPPDVVQLIQESGIRAALKWRYRNGNSEELIRRMVVQASESGFEAISAEIYSVDRETVTLAEQLGIRIVVSALHDSVHLWPTLIEAGLSGLITHHTDLAERVASAAKRMV